MAYIAGRDRTQVVLLPEVLDDYVTADNPVRFLDAFVAQLDLGTLSFQRSVPADTGRPGYDPGDLLRLYLYGYLHRIRSSRRLEQETHRNIELMWLVRGLRPDFKTIADFRRDHPQALKGVCREFILLCKRLDLFGGELLAIDGSKFRAGLAHALAVALYRRYQEQGLKEAFYYPVNEVNTRSRKFAESIGGTGRVLYHCYDKRLG